MRTCAPAGLPHRAGGKLQLLARNENGSVVKIVDLADLRGRDVEVDRNGRDVLAFLDLVEVKLRRRRRLGNGDQRLYRQQSDYHRRRRNHRGGR